MDTGRWWRRWNLNNPEHASMSDRDYHKQRAREFREDWARGAKKKVKRLEKKKEALKRTLEADNGEDLAEEISRPDPRVEEEAKKRFLVQLLRHKQVGMWKGGQIPEQSRVDNWFKRHNGADNICFMSFGSVLTPQELSIMVEDTGVDPDVIAPISELETELEGRS